MAICPTGVVTGGRSIVIVGGGATGVMLGAHLLKSPDPSLRVTLIERRERLGPGVAYSTEQPDHLLNVAATNMGAFADDPAHFWRWLRENELAEETDRPFFAPRAFYGRYLETLVANLMHREAETGRLRLVGEACAGLAPTAAGVEARLANGISIVGHVAVLATGHDEEPAQDHVVRIGSAADTPLDPAASVLILGTGLSMIDAWLTLERRGHRGPITAISRRGLLPAPHNTGKPIRLDSADIPLGTSLPYFVDWLRGLIRATVKSGGNWRDVIDGLRPFNQRIWQSWPASARRRFLDHTKPWWDVHRHRVAPEIHSRLRAALDSGALAVLAARAPAITPTATGFDVRLQRRGQREAETLHVARVYDCTGVARNVATGSNPAIRSLTDRGLARPDPLRLGLDVTEDCAVIDAGGNASAKIFAAGPLTRGAFFEIEAVPDIRVQCARLAVRLAG